MSDIDYNNGNPNKGTTSFVSRDKMAAASADRLSEGRDSWAYRKIVPRLIGKV
jgi:hypothetical protein